MPGHDGSMEEKNVVRVADTSALVAFVSKEDAHHSKAVKAFREPDPVLLPQEILTETVDFLDGRFGFKTARDAAYDILNLRNIRIAPPIHVAAALGHFERNQGKLSFADCVVVETARSWAAPALTFDKGILKALE